MFGACGRISDSRLSKWGSGEVSEWARHNSVAFTLTRYGGLFEDNTEAAIDRRDVLLANSSITPRFERWLPVNEPAGRPINS